ncbi:p-loop containing nucleoside triphosphate hydrolases superfamily protein [Hirschfeldia incana]|nr:p-loop containing nucleoside triphosphate hydrolases superfamily protein [Hirschfeldia incana]
MRIEGRDLIDLVLSWSLEEVLNVDLYKGQVGTIPTEFDSTTEYFKSFIPSLIEETHAALLSSIKTLHRSPVVEINYIVPTPEFELPNNLFYKVHLSTDESSSSLIPKDLIALTDKRPNRLDGFNITNEPYVVAIVCKADPDRPSFLTILASKPLLLENVHQMRKNEKRESLFGVYMTNITTNVRIWNSLHLGLHGGSLNLLSTVLKRNADDNDGVCIQCRLGGNDGLVPSRFLNLNPSQEDAILSCLDVRRCNHANTIKLIWGPPGTGKTKTTSILLFTLLNAKCRTLTCTPTNVSVIEVASRVVKLVTKSLKIGNYGLGDVLLFGNGERMKIKERKDLVDLFIDERVDKLYPCFMPFYGWRASINSMIRLLEDPQGQYYQYLEKSKDAVSNSFQEYLTERFSELRSDLELAFSSLCTHLPTALLSTQAATSMYESIDLVKDAAISEGVSGEGLKSILVVNGDREQVTVEDYYLELLRLIPEIFTLPGLGDKHLIKELCLGHALLLFSTASCSARLYTGRPVHLVVIDEAAQLKECETAIPLLLPGIKHSILIGDEKQLPAMVESQIALEAGFGRSLFERLAILKHKKYLLNIQYRMHRSISLFPNREFYGMQIQDAPTVKQRNYTKQYLPGKMYCPYSFINISHGEEQYGEGRSLINKVEVAVVSDIIANLIQVSERTKTRISVGVISPYKSQVLAIQEKIQETCSGRDAGGLFTLKIRSVDGFQGGEEDIIIVSTVRSNGIGRVGFLTRRQRTNVLLTRARHCLWILGNEATMMNSKTVWRNLIQDARKRDCFHDAEEDESLARAIINTAKIEVDTPLNKSRWKVCFSEEFKKSVGEIKNPEIYRKIKSFLERISQGWLHEEEESERDSLIKQSKIDDDVLRLIWAVEILKEEFQYIQILKIWDVVPSSDSLEAVKSLNLQHHMKYTEDEVEKCRARCISGDIVVPLRWSLESTNGNGSSDVMEETFGSLNLADEMMTSEQPNDLMEDEKEEEDFEIDQLSHLLSSITL